MRPSPRVCAVVRLHRRGRSWFSLKLCSSSYAYELLLEIFGQQDSGLNVLLLGRLVAASQQYDQLLAALRVVHAIPRSEVDFQFTNAGCKNPVLPWITVDQSIHTHLDARATGAVLQRVNPVTVNLGHLY